MGDFRPYQHEFVDATLGALVEFDRVLGVAPTGSGKTVMSGELIRRCIASGCRVLFLADAKELVYQAADKLGKWAGVAADVEMADAHANPNSWLVVATTQSIARRLEKYDRRAFSVIFIDEAHRNTLGAQAQAVINHFESAQVVGLTATPFRSDKKQLGHFYQKIAIDISLIRLIKEGWLSRITIKSVPSGIDLTAVRTIAGDYNEADLGAVVLPHLDRLAAILAEHASNRRTVVFLPLRETSRQFVACCGQHGLRAVHVDGNDRSELATFRSGDANVICNASLLTTGWDEPSVDCVYILRPTKSFSLYSQMVGRGTRICPGKSDLLVLDPLFLSDDLSLIRPARLVAKNDQEAAKLNQMLSQQNAAPFDLLETQERADADLSSDRASSLIARLKECAKRKTRTVDAVEFAMALGDADLADYEPETDSDAAPMTPRQREILEKAKFDVEAIKGKGHASKIIDQIFRRREAGMATPNQLKYLIRLKHPCPDQCTFEEAKAYLDLKWNVRRADTAQQAA